MSNLARFSVSLDRNLINNFDRHIKRRNYPTRSKAIGDLILGELVRDEWTSGKDVAGAIVVVYNHHKRELVQNLTCIQHKFHHTVVSTQHVHLDHYNCLEIIMVRGRSEAVRSLADRIKSTKGVKYSSSIMATTGRDIK